MSSVFDQEMNVAQTTWRARHVRTKEYGFQNERRREWILPKDHWEEGLWPGIRSESTHSLPAYVEENDIQKHLGVHNMKSSWVLCANLYPPGRQSRGCVGHHGTAVATVLPDIDGPGFQKRRRLIADCFALMRGQADCLSEVPKPIQHEFMIAFVVEPSPSSRP